MTTPWTPELEKELFPYGKSILTGYRGSFAQNTYIPSTDPNSIDDIDVMSIYIADRIYYLSYYFPKKFRKGFTKFINEWDAVSYEFKHYIKLLVQQNPNVLSLLWLKPQHYFPQENEKLQSWGELLIDNREVFSSKRAYNSFVGYARGQLKHMTSDTYEGYMGKKRKNLVKKFGYDPKNASHLIRLLKMGIEFLSTGKLQIFRTDDADLLKDIKSGKWKLEEIQEYSDDLFHDVYQANKKSPLPKEPNTKAINDLVISILTEHVCGGTKK